MRLAPPSEAPGRLVVRRVRGRLPDSGGGQIGKVGASNPVRVQAAPAMAGGGGAGQGRTGAVTPVARVVMMARPLASGERAAPPSRH
jgi:hypothetical protein